MGFSGEQIAVHAADANRKFPPRRVGQTFELGAAPARIELG